MLRETGGLTGRADGDSRLTSGACRTAAPRPRTARGCRGCPRATPAVPGAACAASTYAIAIGLPSVGDGAPEVTSPITVPSAPRPGSPARGTRRPSATRPTSLRGGAVSARSAAASSASRPTKSPSFSNFTTRPSPASKGVSAVVSSCPYSGMPASRRSVSRQDRPHGTRPAAAPASVSACHSCSASLGRDEQLEAVLAGVAGAGDQRGRRPRRCRAGPRSTSGRPGRRR